MAQWVLYIDGQSFLWKPGIGPRDSNTAVAEKSWVAVHVCTLWSCSLAATDIEMSVCDAMPICFLAGKSTFKERTESVCVMVESLAESEGNFKTGTRGACGRNEHHPALAIWRWTLAYLKTTQSNILLLNVCNVQCACFSKYCRHRSSVTTTVTRNQRSLVKVTAGSQWLHLMGSSRSCSSSLSLSQKRLLFFRACEQWPTLELLQMLPLSGYFLKLDMMFTKYLYVCLLISLRPCVHSAQPQEWSRLTG